ncbi:chemotaxis protein CheD [Candidatus Dependentiae bacterium]|nr:chemotaxis protein CheD [Candidatus Dependentiae bacterium]
MNNIESYNYMLQPGYIFFSKEPALISTVLGSCISVALYDSSCKFGGMNHYKLPVPPTHDESTALYGIPAIYQLVYILLSNGSKVENLKAQIFGGASNPYFSNNVGEANIEIAEKMINKYKIKIISRDTGGELGRKIIFNTFTGEAMIAKVEKLRQNDWL